MNKMEQYEIMVLWATADEDGGYIDISRDKAQAEEWLSRDDDAVQIIQGYGVLDKTTNLMPDTASDFHYEKETAEAELASFQSGKQGVYA